jgi:hypothetical protein
LRASAGFVDDDHVAPVQVELVAVDEVEGLGDSQPAVAGPVAIVVWRTVMLSCAIAGDSGRTETRFTAIDGYSR